jgi:hypothetical protein
VRIPEVVREKACALGADEWLGALPELVAEVAAEWSLSVRSTGLLATRIGLQPTGREMLATADRIAP